MSATTLFRVRVFDVDAALDDQDSPVTDSAFSPSKKGDKQKKGWLKNIMTIFHQVSGHK